MWKRPLLLATILGLFLGSAVFAEEQPVFSGPQVGEKLTAFQIRGVFDDLAGKEFDLVGQANGKPVVLVFVHSITRPSIGLTRAVMKYAASCAAEGLVSGVVFLTDDITQTEAWMQRARHALPQDVALGVSVDGQEGPGAYGLNRNVTLTVLVGKQGKVTANFALVQPSLQADALKIANQIADVVGKDKRPTLAQLIDRPAAARGRRMADGKLENLLRQVIRKEAKPEDVRRAATAVEQYAAENRAAQRQIGTIAQRIVASGKLANYGTPQAQSYLKKWAKQYAPTQEKRPGR